MGGVGSGRRMEWEEQEVEGERSGKRELEKGVERVTTCAFFLTACTADK